MTSRSCEDVSDKVYVIKLQLGLLSIVTYLPLQCSQRSGLRRGVIIVQLTSKVHLVVPTPEIADS
jgi:hypothetical protein